MLCISKAMNPVVPKLFGFIKSLQKLGFVSCKISSCVIPKGFFEISSEVENCIASSGPVVALESTIITHGMPHPENIRTALKVEEIVRNNNAVPATICILKGKICIGLDAAKLEELSKDVNAIKISRRDLPYVLSQHLSGGTTVASTMALAHRAGISVFVTGGIGGVHKGGETTMDISADLLELSKSPMTVVSAGVKSILDIGRTLEYLETHGVCVASFSSTKDFPAFYVPVSGFESICNVKTPKEAALLIACRDELRLESGILIAVPIPASDAAEGAIIEEAIEQALNESRSQNISGKAVTPFVLARVNELTGGASLKSNVALIQNNARVGSCIAVELSRLKNPGGPHDKTPSQKDNVFKKNFKPPVLNSRDASIDFSSYGQYTGKVVVVGGTGLDINIKSSQRALTLDGSTNDGILESSAGGVGRNLADCLQKLDADPFFISAIGDDDNGATLRAKMSHLNTGGIRVVPNYRTATFAVLLNSSGDCLYIVGDTDIHGAITKEQVQIYESILLQAPLVVIDANIPLETMDYIFTLCSANGIPVWFEPTDVNIAAKSLECDAWKRLVFYASPNFRELRSMHDALCGNKSHGLENLSPEALLQESVRLSLPLLATNVRSTLIVTLGPLGALLVTKQSKRNPLTTAFSKEIELGPIRAVHYAALKPQNVVSVSGAGDCFASGMIAAIVRGYDQDGCFRAGQTAAMFSLACSETVPSTITPKSVLKGHPINDTYLQPRQLRI